MAQPFPPGSRMQPRLTRGMLLDKTDLADELIDQIERIKASIRSG
jgi:hypothetical protein